jgi:hypothetical protein
MTAQALLSDLQALGVTVEAHGDRLRFHPLYAVGPDLLARLREHKAELLAILQAPARDDSLFPPDLQPASIEAESPEIDYTKLHTQTGVTEIERAVRATVTLPVAVGGGSSQAITTDAPYGNSRNSGHTCLPDPRIIADPVVLCPRCGDVRVLPELRAITGGICWPCHLADTATERTDAPKRRPDLRHARQEAAERFQQKEPRP